MLVRPLAVGIVLGDFDRMSLVCVVWSWPERVVVALGRTLLVAACAGDRDPPSIGRAELLPQHGLGGCEGGCRHAAASMISGYRKNNGLGAVAVDPR